ncbi:MAG: N-formylglutamate amidohydrolase [Rhizobiaceae bacterium]|nr:MAG: N-formylglutamate amidohydrolase [Rhizobiaceae bacterium]
MKAAEDKAAVEAAVRVFNPSGRSAFVIVCDHASNHIPTELGTLGLGPEALVSHIAWDPGAIEVARILAERLDATLVESCVSRLVADCNRPYDAPDLVLERSEMTAVPGNADLSAKDRERRIKLAHKPFHDCIAQVVSDRLEHGWATRLVAIHSFTPVFMGVARPWQVGVIHDEDMTLAHPVMEALAAEKQINVGDNEPYSPADRVYYTLDRHARSLGLEAVMIEIRNDEIRTEAGQSSWGNRLAAIFDGIAGHAQNENKEIENREGGTIQPGAGGVRRQTVGR